MNEDITTSHSSGRDLCLENSAHEFGSNGQVWFASFSETTDVILAAVDRTARSANSFEPRPLGGPSEGVFSQEPGSSPDLDGLDIVFTATAGEGDAPFLTRLTNPAFFQNVAERRQHPRSY